MSHPPRPVSRRHFIGAGAAGAALIAADPTITPVAAGPANGGDSDRFTHGVASGDPHADSVILWTRLVPAEPNSGPVEVTIEVAEDEEFETVVAMPSATASADRDYCISVEAAGLAPGTTYWYRFTASDGAVSAVGRTRTAPGSAANEVRFGVVSCARLPSGTFSAYNALAQEDVDAVLHVGDYIYEDANDGHLPARTLETLDDYRERYAQYRSEPALRELHRLHPFVCVWDDHEFANNVWSESLGDSGQREIAVQAWREWLPSRQPDPDDPAKIWRQSAYGDLVDLFCIDTRMWGRDQQATTLADAASGDRTILGADQREWLVAGLEGSTARWSVIANQVMFAPLHLPPVTESVRNLLTRSGVLVEGEETANPDQWDGYTSDRDQVVAAAQRSAASAVVLSGDIHSSWASAIPGSDDARAVLEFVGPSVSSTTFGSRIGEDLAGAATGIVLGANPTLAHAQLTGRGFMMVSFTQDAVTTAYRYVDATLPSGRARVDAVLVADHGDGDIKDRTDDGFPDRLTPPASSGVGGSGGSPQDDAPGAVNSREGSGLDPLVVIGPAAAAVAAVGAAIGFRSRRGRS